jgi:replication initiation protein RepC
MHAPLKPSAQPTGARRLTLTMLAVRDQADQYRGVPRGTAKRFKYLAAFQEAEPYLGLPSQAYKLVAWLVKQTLDLDWEEGSRPIAWPSARRQGEFLALSEPRLKTLNRALFEAGIFVMRDSETGKRYGRRVHPKGGIIEAYGFDLSPLAYRCDEFIRIAAEARAERERMANLRKRATCARRAIFQVGETLTALGPLPSQWRQLALETADLVAEIRQARASEDLAAIVRGLEFRKGQAEAWLREATPSVSNNPEGLADEPHNITTNKPFNPKDTVRLGKESSPGTEPISQPPTPAERLEDDSGDSVTFRPFERLEKLHPAELLELAPRLAEHVTQPSPNWSAVCAAAHAGLRHDLGISQPLWGEACLKLGPVIATVALAIVSTKPKEHFARGAGGYFAAMVKRAKTGDLHLDRSLWKLRRDKWGTRHVH